MCRTTPQAHIRGPIGRHDEATKITREEVGGHTMPDEQWNRAIILVRLGGLGVRGHRCCAEAAHIASRMMAESRMTAISPSLGVVSDQEVADATSRLAPIVPNFCCCGRRRAERGERQTHEASRATADDHGKGVRSQGSPRDRRTNGWGSDTGPLSPRLGPLDPPGTR